MTSPASLPETAPETTEVVEYRVTALRPDGAPAVPWRLTDATAPCDHAGRLRRSGYTGVRVESRTIRTQTSPWLPVDEPGENR